MAPQLDSGGGNVPNGEGVKTQSGIGLRDRDIPLAQFGAFRMAFAAIAGSGADGIRAMVLTRAIQRPAHAYS